MFTYIRQAIMTTLCLALLLCGAYPLIVTGVGATLFPEKAAGSLLFREGKAVGSALIGQNFDARSFQGRPSAAGEGYDAGASSGSNRGPTSKVLAEDVRNRAEALRLGLSARGAGALSATLPIGVLPVDMLTASASGLDPHISPEAALMQVGRVALARSLDPAQVEALVLSRVEERELGIFGVPRVNVLRLNLALETLSSDTKTKN